jgi:type II secretory pathway pseudopilin PulG
MLTQKRGFTFIETMITAAIVTFSILATVNLLTRVYKGISSLQLKTQASNLCSERLEVLKELGFDNLSITPDANLPYPLSNMNIAGNPPNPYPVETITSGGSVYTIYKMVQWVLENADGSLSAVQQASMGADSDQDLKQITVIVSYTDNNNLKTSSMSSLVANREVPIPGASISGKITKVNALGTPMPTPNPGAGSNASIYVVGYPQYTSMQNDANGDYTITNVMPGQYNLYAQGLGFNTTYYSGNPLVVTGTGQIITNINITCQKVDGATVSGNVYIGIPIATFTPTPGATATTGPTPVCNTAVFMGTGAMSGKAQGWSSSNLVTTQDGNWSNSGTGNNSLLYTNFSATPVTGSAITSVKLNALTLIQYLLFSPGTCNFQTHITNNNGTTWAAACCGSPNAWSGAATTNFANMQFVPNSQVVQTIDLTSLYTTWTWTQVGNIGCAVRSQGLNGWSQGYIDAIWLSVGYCMYTPTPVNTPTFTLTPNTTPTPTPKPCAPGSIVKSWDGISLSTVVSSCGYSIPDINPAGGFTSVSASLSYGGKAYYTLMTGVPVAVNNTTYVDIFLVETTGIPTINGNVYDAANTSLPIVGANVYLSDPAALSVITTGGGAYTISPADTGSWILTCAMPGYKMQGTGQSISVVNGINTAANLYMYRVGNVSGQITNQLDGTPLSGINVQLLDTSNNIDGSATTDSTGSFIMTDIPVAANYILQVQTGSTAYTCVFPGSGEYTNVAINQGITLTNQNFKLKQNYQSITGKVQINSADMLSGVLVMAYPVGTTNHAIDYNNSLANQPLQGETSRQRIASSCFGQVTERDATFNLKVPVGQNYDIYAYYSCLSYQSTSKTVCGYYKIYSSVSPTANVNISGALSTWTQYLP